MRYTPMLVALVALTCACSAPTTSQQPSPGPATSVDQSSPSYGPSAPVDLNKPYRDAVGTEITLTAWSVGVINGSFTGTGIGEGAHAIYFILRVQNAGQTIDPAALDITAMDAEGEPVDVFTTDRFNPSIDQPIAPGQSGEQLTALIATPERLRDIVLSVSGLNGQQAVFTGNAEAVAAAS